MSLTHATTKRWTVDEYQRLFESGFIPEKGVELIEGEIVIMPAMDTPHWHAVMSSNHILVLAFNATHKVGCQLPVVTSEMSEPEPDFVIVPLGKTSGRYLTEADLVIEVADSSLPFDRREKASLYARWGVQEYWILNVQDRQLEVHRGPRPDSARPFGFGWTTVDVVPEDGTVTPICRPDVALAVRDLF